MSKNKPNIICFVADQLRADHLGCYGNPDVKTSNIDRIAQNGVLFNNSYVANPVCSPNRASMFTGMYPKAHGLRDNGYTLNRSQRVLPEMLRQEGYKTASFGKLHLSNFGSGPADINRTQCIEEYEHYESHKYWEDHDCMPLPYYGLEHVYLADGHGNYSFGHYKNELEKKHPGIHKNLSVEHSLEPISGARESWKASIPAELHYNTAIANETIKYIKQHDKDDPFFIWCSFPDPHHPYSPPAPYCYMYDPYEIKFDPVRREGELDDLPSYMKTLSEGKVKQGVDNLSNKYFREILAHTYGMITMIDDCVGNVVNSMQSLDILDDTIIVFISDHGDLMGDHWLNLKGSFLFNSLVRVPTIFSYGSNIKSGSVNNAMISTVDLCPTLLDMAGINIPSSIQGLSIQTLLKSAQDVFREYVYIEFDSKFMPQRQIRSKEWALTYDLAGDGGLLFDLKNDPNELYNHWNDLHYENIKKNLLIELLKQTLKADDWFEREHRYYNIT